MEDGRFKLLRLRKIYEKTHNKIFLFPIQPPEERKNIF